MTRLPRAHRGPAGTARWREMATDFVVDELMEVPVHPTGAHWWFHIEKTNHNTKDVARMLAGLGSARIRQVNYAGLKDRRAVVRQWFSAPIETLDPERLQTGLPVGLELLSWQRARHAIRRGGLLGNRFMILLRGFEGDRGRLEALLRQAASGVPNYFGEQRFGRQGANLDRARELFAGSLDKPPRHERGLYLSAARAWLFNLVLARRVADLTWDQLLDGEAIILDGKRSWFRDETKPELLATRLADGDIHPSGPLLGIGEWPSAGKCAHLEQAVLDTEQDLGDGLKGLGMKAERRALRLIPGELEYQWESDNLRLSFTLPRGCFATAVLRELVDSPSRKPA